MIAALDYGRARTGVAILEGGVSLPVEPVTGGGWERILSRIGEMKRERGLELVILGLPLASGGRPTELSTEVEALAEVIRSAGVEVLLQPEAGSTKEVASMPVKHRRRIGRRDSLAAMVILDRYLAER